MSHALYKTQNGYSMAYRGATPWHGLGQHITHNATIEEWLQMANLDWTIDKSPVKYVDSNGVIHTSSNQFVLNRSDNGDELSIVSSKYQPVQPAEILEFYRDLTESQQYTLETAGSLKNGAIIWALAKTNESIELRGNDVINNYLLLATACNKSMSTRAMFTSVRVVCNNTLSIATTESKNYVSVPHSTKFNADSVKKQLGIVSNDWQQFGDIITELSKVKVTPTETAELIYDLFKSPNVDNINGESERNKNKMREIMACVANSPGSSLPSANGTAYGLLNGITYYVDHKANARNADNRLNSAWFGNGATIKTKALEKLSTLVNFDRPKPVLVTDVFPNL